MLSDPHHQPLENFDDIEAKLKMKTVDELTQFERDLADKSFVERMIRFLKSKFKFNVNGDLIFKLVIHNIIDPVLFAPFSWKGKKGKSTANDSFEGKHQTFVKFMRQVVKLSDREKTDADIDKMFKTLLRFKNQMIKRELNRGDKPRNKPSPRIRISTSTVTKSSPEEPTDDVANGSTSNLTKLPDGSTFNEVQVTDDRLDNESNAENPTNANQKSE